MTTPNKPQKSASAHKPTPAEMTAQLVSLLDVETLENNRYLGSRAEGATGRVFGGQVVGQALMAATKAVEADKTLHSLHAYFMRPGDNDLPITYQVERDYDGRSFGTRRVIAWQKDEPILNLAASFQRPEKGLTHQSTMPQVPPPEQLLTDREAADKYAEQLSSSVIRMMKRRRPIEARRVNQGVPFSGDDREPVQHLWFRAAAPLPDDPKIHRAVLAFASDMGLLSTCMRPHAVNWTTPNVQCASLDHALWVHDDFRADEWLLYSMDSPWSGGARGFNRGSIFTRDGRLIASVAQEGLLRIREPK